MGTLASRWGDRARQFAGHVALRGTALPLACYVVLAALAGVYIVYWLVRYPFDGLYGQDSYAYYYQSLEIWRQITGEPVPAWPFVGEGLYHWPVGYHLHVMAGFLAGESPSGGRAITLLMAALTPALVCILTWLLGGLDTGASPGERVVAGSVAGLILLTTGVYARTSVALMSDVPALFWALLGLCCWLRAWPSVDERAASGSSGSRSGAIAALAAGVALGMAVLVRYSSVLFLVPAVVYACLGLVLGRRALPLVALRWAALGVGVAMLPQIVYVLAHPMQSNGAVLLEGWDASHFFATILVRAADGTASFAHSMVEFYLIDPLRDASAGFLSWLCLPAVACGLYVLVRHRRWLALSLLVSWWLVPVLYFAGTAYQAHRFVLVYIPAVAVLAGMGVGSAVRALRSLLRLRGRSLVWAVAEGVVALLVLATTTGGLIYDVRAAAASVRAQAAIKDGELQLVTLVRQAAAQPEGLSAGQVDIVCFGASAMLYHYTGWPVLDLYNHDEVETARLLSGAGVHLVVVPVEQIRTQWQGMAPSRRWQWLQNNYRLLEVGRTGEYTVFRVYGVPR